MNFLKNGKVILAPFGAYLNVRSTGRKQNNGIVRPLKVLANSKYLIRFLAYKQCETKVRFAVFDEHLKELDLLDYPEIHRAKTAINYLLTSEIDRLFHFGIIFDCGKIDDSFVIEHFELQETSLKSEEEKLNAILRIADTLAEVQPAAPAPAPAPALAAPAAAAEPDFSLHDVAQALTKLKTEFVPEPKPETNILLQVKTANNSSLLPEHNVLSDKYRPIYEERIRQIHQSRASDIVELGCNDALFASELSRSNYFLHSYKGYDINPLAIILARRRFTSAKVYRFFIKDVDAALNAIILPKPAVYLAFQIFEHMRNDLECIAKMASGSLVLFNLPNYKCNNCFREFKSDADIVQRYSHLLSNLTIQWYYMEGMPMFECVGTRI